MYIIKQLKNNFYQFIFLSISDIAPVYPSLEPKKALKIDESQKNLTPEQQKVVNKIKEIEKKLNEVWTKEKFSKESAIILYKWLTWDPAIKSDPEAQKTIKLFERYKEEFIKAKWEKGISEEKVNSLKSLLSLLSEVLDTLEFNNWTDDKWWKLKYDKEKLKTINSKDFLSLWESERLQYVTKWNIDSDNVANWNIRDIEIIFDQDWDWKINQELYLLTSAWEIMPKEVRQIISDWKSYLRNWLTWEFYSWDKRLTIHEWTHLQIEKLWTESELKEIEVLWEKKYSEFIKNHSEYSDIKFTQTLKEIFKKWLDKENEILFLLSWDPKKLEWSNSTDLKKLLFVSTYLKNWWFLDDYTDAWELVTTIKEILETINKYWKWLKYKVSDDWNIKFDLDNNWLPEWLSVDASLEKFTQIALSQLWTSEIWGWADKYFSWIWHWNLNSRSTPWCGAFVNWTLKQAWYKWISWLSAKEFIWETWHWHAWIKLWDKLLWWNQWNKVSLVNIRRPVVWYAIPTENWLEVHKPGWELSKIPDWAILVFDRSVKR